MSEEMKAQPLITFINDEEKEVKEEKKPVAEHADKVSLINYVDDPGKTLNYLVLLSGFDENGDEYRDWKIIHGRDATYEFIKLYIGMIDLKKSYIISTEGKVCDRIRIIDYLIHVLDSGKIEDPEFDPRDYCPDYEDETTEEEEE